MASRYNSTSDTLVSGTSKADLIENDNADNVTISAGAGNDSIENYSGYYASIGRRK